MSDKVSRRPYCVVDEQLRLMLQKPGCFICEHLAMYSFLGTTGSSAVVKSASNWSRRHSGEK
jgi:hypothetical protein